MFPIQIPIDFNSLSKIENGVIKLSDYYVDYAFGDTKNTILTNNLAVTFYDEGWTTDPSQIICLDGTLIKEPGDQSWIAELKGQVYTSSSRPLRKYFSSFIGANTMRLAEDGSNNAEQKVGVSPTEDKLSGINCFAFPSHSPLPNFSKIVGMNPGQIQEFFAFADLPKPQTENDELADDTLVVRGGSNRTGNYY